MKTTPFQRTIFFCLACILCSSCTANKKSNINKISPGDIQVHQNFNKYFSDCGVNGNIIIHDLKNNSWIVNDTAGLYHETLPASSFKIINLLIALETGVIENENEVVKWVGYTDTTLYGYRPDIYHDMTVKHAFEVSAGWVFIELAKKIGKERYRRFLELADYGNGNLSKEDEDFWNYGEFGVSAVNQVLFLKNMYEYKLPFSKKNIDIVKRVMIAEKGDSYTISAKTGWTRDKGINTGWWIGYVETGGEVFFFTTKLLQDRKYKRDDFPQCRKDITKTVLKDLNIIR